MASEYGVRIGRQSCVTDLMLQIFRDDEEGEGETLGVVYLRNVIEDAISGSSTFRGDILMTDEDERLWRRISAQLRNISESIDMALDSRAPDMGTAEDGDSFNG